MMKRSFVLLIGLVISVIIIGCSNDSHVKQSESIQEEKNFSTDLPEIELDNEDKENFNNELLSEKQENKVVVKTEKEVKEYIRECEEMNISYSDLIRYDSNFKGNDYRFEVRIAQVLEDDGYRGYIIYPDGESSDKEVAIDDKRCYDTTKILVDDRIVFYGKYNGVTSVTRALTGVTEECPLFSLYAADILGEVYMPKDEMDDDEKNLESGVVEDAIANLDKIDVNVELEEEVLYKGITYAGYYKGSDWDVSISMFSSDIFSLKDSVGNIETEYKKDGNYSGVRRDELFMVRYQSTEIKGIGNFDVIYKFVHYDGIGKGYFGVFESPEGIEGIWFNETGIIDEFKLIVHYES